MARFAIAEDVRCKITGAVRCMCPASMSVKCGSSTGYIDNKEPVKAVSFSYSDGTAQTGVMMYNPKGTARDFYTSSNDEIKAELRKRGVDPEKVRISIGYIEVSGSAKLYDDPDEKTPGVKLEACKWESDLQQGGLFATKGRARAFKIGGNCPKVPLPKELCMGQVVCGDKSKMTACEGSGDSQCPPADECLNQHFQSGNPNNLQVGEVSLEAAKKLGYTSSIASIKIKGSKGAACVAFGEFDGQPASFGFASADGSCSMNTKDAANDQCVNEQGFSPTEKNYSKAGTDKSTTSGSEAGSAQ